MKGGQRWLFLGEATFTYCTAVLRSGLLKRCEEAVATCYLDEPDSKHVFGDIVQRNVDELQAANVKVMYGVDATKPLPGVGLFDRVFFMFPNVDQKGRIDLSKQLMKEICVNVPSLMRDEGQFLIALAAGQGGTKYDGQYKRDLAKNSWEILKQGNVLI